MKKIFTLPFVLILLIDTFNGVASNMINPSLTEFLTGRDVSIVLAGVISSLLSWTALLVRPVSGVLADTLNKKKLLFASYFAITICLLLYTVIPSTNGIIFVRVVHGVFFCLSSTLSMLFSTLFIPKERLGEGLGYLSLSTLLATVIGPQIGNIVTDAFGINNVFLFAATAEAIATIIVLLLPYKNAVVSKEKKSLVFTDLFAAELWVYVLLISLFSFGNGIVSYYLKGFGTKRGIPNIVLFYSVNSAVLLLIKPFSGKLYDRKGISVILYPAFIVTSVGMFILAEAHSLLPVLFAAGLKAIGQGSGSPAIQVEAVKMLDERRKGVAISTCYIGMDIGNALGPIFAGAVLNISDYRMVWLLYATVLLVGVLIFHVYYQRKHNEKTYTVNLEKKIAV